MKFDFKKALRVISLERGWGWLLKRRNIELVFFFFFQAEDGIRDYKVTGVQTCALPI